MNGVNGTVDHSGALKWNLGLVNKNTKKYLTAEPFGFKINATGTTLKKKQIWTIDPDQQKDVVYLRSHLGRYLSGVKDGTVTCTAEERGPSEQFEIVVQENGSWKLKNAVTQLFFGGRGDNLHCNLNAKDSCDTEIWTPHLAVHPQVNLRNVNRDRYAHLVGNEIHCNELIPWGQDALITIEFRDDLYAVKTCDGRYLSSDGSLSSECSPETLYRLEIRGGQHGGLSLKDNKGKYLTNVGPTGTVKTRNSKVTLDEMYVLEDSHPQVTFTAHNGRYVSIKQGVDVTANQGEVTDQETFQMEFGTNKKVSIRTSNNKYWSLESNNGIREAATKISSSTEFDLQWNTDGSCTMKASNGKYVTAKMNGSLYASSDASNDKERLIMRIVNRPIIVLRGSHGFVGLKGDSGKVECNRSSYEMFTLIQAQDGTYSFKSNGKYWAVDSDGSISSSGANPTNFILEFRELTKFAIKAPNGNYLKGEQNGLFKANGTEVNTDTLWEY